MNDDSTAGSPSDDAPAEPSRPDWLTHFHQPSDEEQEQWETEGFPPHIEIVAGFLMSNNLVFGVPDKEEIFRLDQLRQDSRRMFGAEPINLEDRLQLRYVQPSPIPSVHYEMAFPPFGQAFGDTVEVSYNVRLQALIRQMVLSHIWVLHGSATDDDPKIVFEATEYPGAAVNQEIRVVRITVHNADYATWEEVSHTVYPRSFW